MSWLIRPAAGAGGRSKPVIEYTADPVFFPVVSAAPEAAAGEATRAATIDGRCGDRAHFRRWSSWTSGMRDARRRDADAGNITSKAAGDSEADNAVARNAGNSYHHRPGPRVIGIARSSSPSTRTTTAYPKSKRQLCRQPIRQSSNAAHHSRNMAGPKSSLSANDSFVTYRNFNRAAALETQVTRNRITDFTNCSKHFTVVARNVRVARL